MKSVEESCNFYIRKLGFLLSFRMGDLWAELLGPGGVRLGIYPFDEGEEPFAPKGVSVNIGTLDLPATIKELKKRGVKTFHKKASPQGPVVLHHFADPDGLSLTLIGMAEPPKEAQRSPAKKTKKGAKKAAGGAGGKDPDESAFAPTHEADEHDAYGAGPQEAWSVSDPALCYNQYGAIVIAVSDMDAAMEFYREKLGWRLAYRMADMWMEIVAPGGVRIGFNKFPGADDMERSGYEICPGTKSNKSAKKVLTKNGIRGKKFWVAADKVGPMHRQHLADPYGNRIALVSESP